MQHYYTPEPNSKEQDISYSVEVLGKKFHFVTNSGVFSKHALDFGSQLLVETFIQDVNRKETKRLLDFGCGYGPVGIIISSFFPDYHIALADINRRALEAVRKNIIGNQIKSKLSVMETDGFSNITENYDYILSNPPIRAGKQVVFSIYEGAYEHLNLGGKLYVVIQKKQGAPSSMQKLESLFGNCEVIERKAGYHILCSEKE